jgi:hypothetical protein
LGFSDITVTWKVISLKASPVGRSKRYPRKEFAMMRLMLVLVTGLLAIVAAHAVGPDQSTLANDPEYRAAETFIQRKKYAEALPYLLSIEKDVKDNADVYNYLGLVYRKHRDFVTT